MALRHLSRTVPRLASRTYSTALRPSFTATFRPSTSLISRTIQPRFAAFSTTPARLDSAGEELAAKLESEISIEKQDSEVPTDSDSNVKTFLADNDFWTLEDQPGEHHVVLRRPYDDENITVTFSVIDFENPSMMAEEDEAFEDEDVDLSGAQSGGANTKGAINQGRTSGGNFKIAPEDSIAPSDREGLEAEEEDYNSQQGFAVGVNVLITRPGEKGSLRLNLLADNGRWIVQRLTHLPPSSSVPSVTDLFKETPDALYTGPQFEHLDEQVQELLEQYIEARGINTALAMFVQDYVDVKEQKEYVHWLERVRDFVA